MKISRSGILVVNIGGTLDVDVFEAASGVKGPFTVEARPRRTSRSGVWPGP